MVKTYKLLRFIQEREKSVWVSLMDPETEEVFSSVWLPKSGCRLDEFDKIVEVDEWVIDGNPNLNPVQEYVSEAVEYLETARNCIEYSLDILRKVRINVDRNK